MQGRKPTPTALKLLRGNPGKRPMNDNEPVFDSADSVPEPPAGLGVAAASHWVKMAGLLHPQGLLTVADYDALARYCEVYARWAEAQKELSTHGLLVKAQNGFPVQSPYIAISNKCVELLNKIGAEFGLTPSTRTRISVPKPEKPNVFSNYRKA